MNSSLKIAKEISVVSFTVGTLLLVLFLLFKQSDRIIILGIYFMIFALLINSTMFIILLVRLIIKSENRVNLLKAIGVTIFNIPIAIGYFFIVINTI